MIVRYRRA